jgi:hypothetical protein
MGLGSRAFRRAEILLVHKGLLQDYCLQVGLKLLVRHLHRIYLAMYVHIRLIKPPPAIE